jgi:hypothetical protein
MAATAEIKGNQLLITIDMQTPAPSASGKTLIVASTRGNQATTAQVNGQPVVIGVNAYINALHVQPGREAGGL